jgi:hypothetical protein
VVKPFSIQEKIFMSNYITASVEFFFKGNRISSSIELSLDPYMQSTGKIPNLFPLLAKAGGLDVYSYEYEMMQAEEINFSNAEGMVADFVSEGKFDIEAFTEAWMENKLLEELQKIAHLNLAVNNLQNQPDLKQALLEAYRLGAATAKKQK